MTHREAASVLGVSTKTVQRHRKALRPETDELLEKYRSLLHEKMPIEARVDRLVELAEGEHAPTALKALHRADEIDGLAGRREDEGEQPQAAFLLPPGCTVSVAVPRIIDAQATPEEKP